MDFNMFKRVRDVRYVIYAYDPQNKIAGLLGDDGRLAPDFNMGRVFDSQEAAFLLKDNTRYHCYVLQLLY